MAVSPEQKHLHSAEYFGEYRDYWWNPDFLGMMSARLDLGRARRILDVGSGLGHWGRALMPHLDPGAELVGIDREAAWVEGATRAAEARGWGGRMRYQVADAERIPFSDGEFDLVTCQTVLIHVRDCREVLREMARVLRPGGRLLTVEPNNLAGAALRVSRAGPRELDDLLRLVRFQAICERGKEALGEGYNSVGDRLPGLYLELGLGRLEVYQSDHAYLMAPPYDTPPQRALKEQLLEWGGGNYFGWSHDMARRYFLAGGGGEEEFAALWALGTGRQAREVEAIRRGEYCEPGGSIVYLVTGVKGG